MERRTSGSHRDHRSLKSGPNGDAVVDSSSILNSLGGELLGVCMAALGEYGIKPAAIAHLAAKAATNGGETPTARALFADVDKLGDLANEWAENPDFLDSTGKPKILPIHGTGVSFAGLVDRFFPGRRLEEIIEMGCRTRVLERVGASKVAQFGGCVIFAGNPTLMLAHAIHSIRWFLTTTLVNAGRKESYSASPDRRACSQVPAELYEEFSKVMRQPLINLVEMGNRWLSARAPAPPEASGKTVAMGVHAYVFRDP